MDKKERLKEINEKLRKYIDQKIKLEKEYEEGYISKYSYELSLLEINTKINELKREKRKIFLEEKERLKHRLEKLEEKFISGEINSEKYEKCKRKLTLKLRQVDRILTKIDEEYEKREKQELWKSPGFILLSLIAGFGTIVAFIAVFISIISTLSSPKTFLIGLSYIAIIIGGIVFSASLHYLIGKLVGINDITFKKALIASVFILMLTYGLGIIISLLILVSIFTFGFSLILPIEIGVLILLIPLQIYVYRVIFSIDWIKAILFYICILVVGFILGFLIRSFVSKLGFLIIPTIIS